MPVFTAAVIAIAAAVATTTVATVATAVVATSVAIGTLGAAVSVAGMVTGNKDLMFAGKIMGYVGMAGGLAGGVMGGLGAVAGAAGSEGLSAGQGFADAYAGYSQSISKAWDQGIGSFFQGGGKLAGAVDETGGLMKSAPNLGPQSSPGNGMGNFPEVANSPTATNTPINEGVSVAKGPVASAQPQGASVSPTAPTAASPVAPSPGTPTINIPGVSQPNGIAGNVINGPGSRALQNATPGVGAAPEMSVYDKILAAINSGQKAASDMPDWMKYSLMTTGAQGVSGMIGGYFQAQQAKVQAAQQQQQIDQNNAQRLLLNQQGNMVPELAFTNRY